MVTSDGALPNILISSLKKSSKLFILQRVLKIRIQYIKFGSEIVLLLEVTIDQCKKACTLTSECSSLSYEPSTKSCTLNRRSVQTGNQLIFVSGTDYYEKICLTGL